MKVKIKYWTNPKHLIAFILMIVPLIGFIVTFVIGQVDLVNRIKAASDHVAEPNQEIMNVVTSFFIVGSVTLIYFVYDYIFHYSVFKRHVANSEENTLDPGRISGETPLFNIKPNVISPTTGKMVVKCFLQAYLREFIVDIILVLAVLSFGLLSLFETNEFFAFFKFIAIGIAIGVIVLLVVIWIFRFIRINKSIHRSGVGYKIYDKHIDEYMQDGNNETLLSRTYYEGSYHIKEDREAFTFNYYLEGLRSLMIIPRAALTRESQELLRKKVH